MHEKKISFETALKKLEESVKKLEEGDLSLEQSLKVFEEGIALSKFCETALNEANGRVEKLMTDAQGQRKKVPFESSDS